MSSVMEDLARLAIDDVLLSDENFVVLQQTEPIFHRTVGGLHSEVHALLEVLAHEWPTPADVAQRIAKAYVRRRLIDVARTMRDLDRLERHLRMTTVTRPTFTEATRRTTTP